MSWNLYNNEEIVLTPWETAQIKMSLPCKLPADTCLLISSQLPNCLITSVTDDIIAMEVTWMPDPLSVLEIKFNPIADSAALTYRGDASYIIPVGTCFAQAVLVKEQKEKKPRVKKVSDDTLKLREKAKADLKKHLAPVTKRAKKSLALNKKLDAIVEELQSKC